MRKTASFTTSNRTVVHTICFVVLTYFIFSLSGSLSRAGTTPFAVLAADPTVWSLAWSDEFNGADGSAVDQSKWTAEVGGSGWGNHELEYYTTRTANAYHSGGSLVIKAIRETYTGSDNVTRDYTSARLITRNNFTATYGRFEARIKLPYGQGIWPAFWLLGSNIGSVGWPQCGEVDIMENIGREPSIIHGTLHGPGYSAGNGISSSYSLPANQRFADSFHTFAVEWEPNVVRFYCDGILYKTRTPADLPQGQTWVFNHPFFILLNLAVGGDWPGNPDGTTVFPQTLQVDYVRVYQRSTPSSTPVMLTEEGLNRALALDSVLWTRDPFRVASALNFSQDQHTRLMLLVANVDLLPGDDASVVTAQAQDSQGNIVPLTVENVVKVPSFDWITEVIVRLPDGLGNLMQAQVSVNVRGAASNRVLINIRQ